MSDANIQVILNELINLKDDIKEIKESLKEKCDTCPNSATFRERLRSQYTHIRALWATVTALGAYFYNHIVNMAGK